MRYAIVLIALFACIALGLSASVASAAVTTFGPNPPRAIRLSYMNNPSTAVITWHTATASTSRVDWGPSPGPHYAFSMTGTDFVSPGGNTFLHTATLTGLTPSTTYYYRVGDAAMNSWAGEGTFRSAPSPDGTESFTFAAAGDFGDSTTTQTTSNAIAAANPDLVLLLGDLWYSTAEGTIRNVFNKWQAFSQSAFTMAVPGNHEFLDPTINVYCAFVIQPGNERTYAFTYGNAYFVAIDWGAAAESTTDGVDGAPNNCTGVEGNSAIRSWVDDRLAAANSDPKIKWKIVMQHYPCYLTDNGASSTTCPDGTGSPDQIEDIFVARGVDFVLTAHDHTYGRTHPVRFNTPTQTGSSYADPGAPMYFVIGTGGRPSTASCKSAPYIAVCRAAVASGGYGKFVVGPNTVAFQFVDNTAGVVDSFTLTKGPVTDYQVSVNPGSIRMGRSESASAAIQVTGFSASTVTLGQMGCPTDATCTFSPASGIPNFGSTLTITTSASTPLGAFPITIQATNATQTKTATLGLEVSTQSTRTFARGDGGAHSETDDTYLYSGSPGTNYGTSTKLYVDASGCNASGTVCKFLMKFPDIIGGAPDQVLPSSTINSATLEITVTDAGGPQNVKQVTETWSELDATWNSFAVPGSPGAKPRATSFTPGTTGRISVDITSIVQAWAVGEANHGILVDSTDTNGADYDSSESARPPKLTVTFSPPAGPQLFDFSVSVNPSTGSVAPGGSATPIVTASLLSGSPEPVGFTCTGLPTEGTCTFTPQTCSPTCTSATTISTAPDTPVGTYAITITGSNGTLTRSTTYTLTVSNSATVSFQKGDGGAYSETDDTYIYSGSPGTNYGTQTALYVDASGCIASGTICKFLMKFPDIIGGNSGQIPPGATIVKGTIEFTITDKGGAQNVHQATEGWGELTATWNSFIIPGSPGAKPTATTFTPTTTGRISVDITTIVQAWAAGEANHGILVDSTNTDGADYASSESSNRPKLIVTYEIPTGPAGIHSPEAEEESPSGNGTPTEPLGLMPASFQSSIDCRTEAGVGEGRALLRSIGDRDGHAGIRTPVRGSEGL